MPSQGTEVPALAPSHSVYAAGERWICQRCRNAPSQLDGVRAYAFHDGPLRKAIHEFKYSGLRSLATILGDLMGQGWDALAPDGKGVDVIVPVPLHSTRQRERGFNQAALLARELGAVLRHPVAEDVLVRSKPTTPQVGLGAEARRANVDGAFQCNSNRLSGMCLLLVDDVYTTGSTLEAACSALLRTGVQSVWAYTLARAGGRLGDSSHIIDREAGQWN